jgi:hypothetical protein
MYCIIVNCIPTAYKVYILPMYLHLFEEDVKFFFVVTSFLRILD